MRWWTALILLAACNLDLGPPVGPCSETQAWYPDDDGDGVGEAAGMYVGCDPPPGWVTELGEDTTDTADSGDSG